MGILLSRVRKKKSTIETLEKLDNDIKEMEENRMNAQRKYKRITKLFLIYTLGLYIVCGILFYFQYTSTVKGKLLYLVPLAISPLILYFVKIIVSWYYVRVINKNQTRLNEMKKEKKRILEEVMDKETYKVAKEILEKFSPPEVQPKTNNYAQLMPMKFPDNGVRKRIVKGTTSVTSVQPSSNMPRGFPPNQTPIRPVTGPTPMHSLPAPGTPMMGLPAPILPQHRSYVDRVVEYLIGDGINNRYALICSQCHSHNGMALKEEFEYICFKCCYCYFFNPARKIRPEAPKLENSLRFRRVSESDSDKTSGENSDVEHKISPDKNQTNTEISNPEISNMDTSNLIPDETEETNEPPEEEKSITDIETETKQPAEEEETVSSQPESNADCDQSLLKS